jgi:4-diphosphocytidyl-2-C-methyl-D-erythritol kinase
LGADVPFFLIGGCALMSGHGEILERQITLPPLDIVLVKPTVGLSTGRVYQKFDQLFDQVSDQVFDQVFDQAGAALPPQPAPADAPIDIATFQQTTAQELAAQLQNNLTAAATAIYPIVGRTIHALARRPGVLRALLAGSGSAVFGLCENREFANAAASYFTDQGYWTAVARTTAPNV